MLATSLNRGAAALHRRGVGEYIRTSISVVYACHARWKDYTEGEIFGSCRLIDAQLSSEEKEN